jgi:hypothetical protein
MENFKTGCGFFGKQANQTIHFSDLPYLIRRSLWARFEMFLVKTLYSMRIGLVRVLSVQNFCFLQ